VNFPKWGDDVRFTVAELRDGRPVAYPDEELNRTREDDPAAALVSVQSVVVDPLDRLWILDTGSPMFRPTEVGGPKLVCVDLATDRVVRRILLPREVALPTTYLNDIRFDLRRGAGGVAFITDSADKGPNGIIVVDLASGESWRRLHDHPSTKAEGPESFLPVVEGRPLHGARGGWQRQPAQHGADGIAISADGARLYYCPLASRKLYSVSAEALADRAIPERRSPRRCGTRATRAAAPTGSRATMPAASTRRATSMTRSCAAGPDGAWETLVHDPRLLWPDTMSVAADGHL
jgi:sugar lactone lactonase YvrE